MKPIYSPVLHKFFAALMVVILATTLLPATPAYAATFTVSKINDTNDGTCNADCSLREAIVAANATAGADIITLTSGSTYTLSLAGAGENASATGDLDVTDAAGLVINTTGAGAATINANSIDRVLEVRPGAVLTLNNINITNGSVAANGGGMLVAGNTSITGGTFSTNATTAGNDGGAIYVSAGTVTISGTAFTSNTSADDGGALYLIGGATTISDATFTGNTGFDIGGAMRIDASNTSITRTTFRNNAGNSGNTNPGAGGGGIFINETANNTTITLSTFNGNSTTRANNARGGGIYNEAPNVIIANSTFTGNSANDNVAGVAGDVAQGGAIFQNDVGVPDPSMTLYNVTFSGNSTTVTGLGTASGASIYKNTATGTITVANTIVANGTPNNCSGSAVADGGNNINFNPADCGFTNTNNPSFGALTGSPAYFPLNAGSPAINTGSNAVCANASVNNLSQNGATRPVAVTCDIGSYEYPNTAPTLTTAILDVNVLEDAADTAFSLYPNFQDAESADPVLTYTVEAITNTALFTSPAGVLPITIGDPTNFTLNYAPDANGSSDITIRATDPGGLFVEDTFTVTATAVNDQPDFTASNPPAVNENAAAQVVAGWVTAVDFGPADEDAAQSVLGYTISNSTCGILLSAGPSVNAAGTLTYTPAANQNGTCTFDVQVQDNGGIANSGVDTGPTHNFTITVNAVNDPSVAVNDTATVAEDAAATTINVRGNDTDADSAVEFIASVTQPANGTVVITNAGVDLTYQPSTNYCNDGTPSDNFTYTLAGGSTATVAVTVNCVNDAPSFTGSNPPAVAMNAGAQTINAWATFNPGPNEAGQTVLQYNVSGSTCGTLLSAGPSVNAAGTLTYTPAAEQTGSCTFDLTVTDNGGTANGGVDTSSPAQTFTITVNVPSITLLPASLPDGNISVPYSPQTITASGGTSPYTFAVTAGSLPTGLTLTPAGVLSGTPTALGIFNFTITATDSSGGSGPFTGSQIYSITINSSLSVTIDQSTTPAQADPTNISPINFTVVFSAATANFATGDVTLSGTAGATTAVVTETGPLDGTTYTVAVSGMTGNGTVIATIAASVATDAASNPNAPSTSTDNTVTFDLGYPTVTSTSLSARYTGTGPGSITAVFSKAVNEVPGPNSATNINNYRVINRGSDGDLDTVNCAGGVQAGDTQEIINSVAYNNVTFRATLTLAGPLPIGSYRLFICGSTSIVDLAGNRLNNGTDSTFDFVVQAATTTAAQLPLTGFPIGEVSSLPIQTADKAYASLPDLWLEIPKLKLKLPIVGVPSTTSGWDVTWLGENAGWLEGSAFPTWAGNSVITAHVWDALNNPGPFASIKDLGYGDQFKIHAYGQVYTYEVRDSLSISSTNKIAVFKHEKLSWITLVTCEDYKETTKSYSHRRIVRAVLVSMTKEK